MLETHDLIECPLCRSRLSAPRRSGQAVFICRNGHRFIWDFPERPMRWLSRAQVVTIIVFAIMIALIFAAQHWPARVPFLHLG